MRSDSNTKLKATVYYYGVDLHCVIKFVREQKKVPLTVKIRTKTHDREYIMTEERLQQVVANNTTGVVCLPACDECSHLFIYTTYTVLWFITMSHPRHVDTL